MIVFLFFLIVSVVLKRKKVSNWWVLQGCTR